MVSGGKPENTALAYIIFTDPYKYIAYMYV